MLGPIGKTHGIDPKRRQDIKIIYGEPQPGLANLLRACLKREGFTDIVSFTTFPPLLKALREFDTDILIADSTMPGGDTLEMIRDIREGRLGNNPFLPTIMTAWNPSLAFTAAVSDSGCDDLLVKPISPDQILERIGVLVHHRKPFIVTGDYIGPERHPDDEPGARRVAVPNTLKAKVEGQPSRSAAMDDAFDGALRTVNEQRLRSQGDSIMRLVREILPSYTSGRATPATERAMERLLARADDAHDRLAGTAYAPIGDLCVTLREVARAILRAHPEPTRKDLDILPRLAEAIVVGFSDAREAEAIGGQIATSVGSYLGGRAAQAG